MKEVEGGRRPTKGRRGTVQSRKRWTDKSASTWSKCGELRAQSDQLPRKEWVFCSTRQFFKEIAILWRNNSILNDESKTTRVNVWVQRKSEKQRQIQWANIHGYTHYTLSSIRIYIFFVSNFYSNVISERFSYQLDIKFWLNWDFFNHGTRLLQSRRVQSRFRGTRIMPYTPVSCGTGHSFRGTRTMPYAYWGSECQSERAPAWRENAFRSCLLDWQIDRDTAGTVNEWTRETEVKRRIDKTANNQSKWAELMPK